MRTPFFERLTFGLICLAVLVGMLGRTPAGRAYQLAINPFPEVAPPGPVTLTAAQVPVVSGATAARLEQVRKIVVDRNWDDAIDTLRDLAGGESDRVVAVDESRYVSVRTYCHIQIARLPVAGLARYRQRVDALAEGWYRDGVARRDEGQLGRVVDESYCSSWGDDALLALGELALERADYEAARRYWIQINASLFEAGGAQAWLVYPDSPLDLAGLRARLVLVSIRAGQLDRARAELDAFRRLHPQAVGRLGGQDGLLADALERVLTTARQWPSAAPSGAWTTFAGSPARNAIAPELDAIEGPAWPGPIKLRGMAKPAQQQLTIVNGQPRMVVTQEPQRPLCYFPVSAGGRIFYADATRVYAAQLADGQPALAADGTIYFDQVTADAGELLQAGNPAAALPQYTLSLAGGTVYGRVGAVETSRLQENPSAREALLVGLDVSRDGLLALSLRPGDKDWAFDGVPVGDGRNVYVAMRRSDVNPHAAVAAFDAVSGRMLWRTSVGSADTPSSGRSDEVTHNLLTRVGEWIYFNTNLGLAAALRASDGAICWLHRYERRKEPIVGESSQLPAHFDRDPSAALYYDGMLLVAPSDTPSVFALDADTGRQLWLSTQLADALDLLGVVDDSLIASGSRVWNVDVRSGRIRWAWPANDGAAVRGMGRGVIAGHEVFWPTAKEIQVLDVASGKPTQTAIDIAALGGFGANLIVADGRLIGAGNDRMMAYGPAPPPRDVK